MSSPQQARARGSLSQNNINQIEALFPDICHDYLARIHAEQNYDLDAVVNRIFDETDRGQPYPRRPKTVGPTLKRKRTEPDEPPCVGKALPINDSVMADRRHITSLPSHIKTHIEKSYCQKVISLDFPQIPSAQIARLFQENNYLVIPTYLALDEILVNWDSIDPKPWIPKATGSGSSIPRKFLPENLKAFIKSRTDKHELEILEGLQTARTLVQMRKDARERGLDDPITGAVEQKTNPPETTECQCCFADDQIDNMIHCNGEVVHFFCVDCARRNAETAIGLSKYELCCMSMDKCPGGFSHSQRARFLNENLNKALDRIESEAVLRIAGLENLETCPFCDFAAEYPPVEEDKEFRCQQPECMEVSCRMCRAKTHVPRTCEEEAKENGLSARRDIEEAMSAAMIRKCNKCNTPFVKESGCNKMTCPRPGCRNTQCYVCSKTCEYSHFNDTTRGGREGNCPLYDSVEARHANEVKQAEEAATKAVAEQRPDIDPELLKIKMSKKVEQGPVRVRKNDQHARQGPRPRLAGRVVREAAARAAAAAAPRVGAAQQPAIVPQPAVVPQPVAVPRPAVVPQQGGPSPWSQAAGQSGGAFFPRDEIVPLFPSPDWAVFGELDSPWIGYGAEQGASARGYGDNLAQMDMPNWPLFDDVGPGMLGQVRDPVGNMPLLQFPIHPDLQMPQQMGQINPGPAQMNHLRTQGVQLGAQDVVQTVSPNCPQVRPHAARSVAQGQAHDERERQRGLTRIQAVDEARKQAEAGFANSLWDLPGPSNHAQAPRFAGFGMLLSPEPFRCGGEQPAASAQLWPDDLLFDDLPLPNLQLFADAPARHEVAAAPQPRRPHHVPESIGVDLRRRPHAMMPPRTYTHRASRPGGPI